MLPTSVEPEHYFIVGIGLLVLAAILLWFVPRRQAEQYRGQPDVNTQMLFNFENEARRTLSQIIGGLVVLIGVLFTWRQLTGVEEGRITDRYAEAVNQLDADNSVEVRLGGIYALERVALDSERDRGSIRDVLAAFVRTNACWEDRYGKHACPQDGEEAPSGQLVSIAAFAQAEEPPQPTEDVIAALAVISTLSQEDDAPSSCLNLNYTNLRDVDLSRFTLKNVCFDGSYLRGTNFDGAQLHHARFANADLSGARFDRAVLADSDLTGASLYGASFYGASLEGTNLRRAKLADDDLADEDPDPPDAFGLSDDQLKNACPDTETDFPLYVDRHGILLATEVRCRQRNDTDD